ncbi:phage terminase, large subunit, PBSX family (TIGR01547) [uncultured Mediterranean phage uvMED]|nr:phage terminase, large subunit, PBSX family (TIGR01547) [uncultured Mediterranean phage uvMED]
MIQKVNRQFYDLKSSTARLRVHQGGTRSGKTYAVCQYLIWLLTESKEPLVISIIRKTLPALKGSVQRDFLEIAEAVGMYDNGANLNKVEGHFTYSNHLVEFLSVDTPQKIRGRKRNIAFLNEANELDMEDFRQINMRCTDFMILDFNPSDPVHWIYDEIIPRNDCDTWITTYKDNKFLPDDLVYEIERMRERDPDYWRVFGEGQKAVFSARQIFTNWTFISNREFPEFDRDSEGVIGLDFGYTNDPTSANYIVRKGDNIYIHELIYKTGLTNSDIVDELKHLGYDQTLIFYDAAEPKSGEEMKRLGMFVKPAVKGTGSINAGISLLKEFNIIVSQESKNIIKEYNNYYWQEIKDGTIINKPVDRFNHAMDAIRYGVYSQYAKRADFFVI